jgi:hypothetical protein
MSVGPLDAMTLLTFVVCSTGLFGPKVLGEVISVLAIRAASYHRTFEDKQKQIPTVLLAAISLKSLSTLLFFHLLFKALQTAWEIGINI